MRVFCLLFFAFILSLTGCGKSHNQPILKADGGADGGGGDTVADSRLSKEDLAILRSEGPFLTRAILNYQETLDENDLKEVISKLNGKLEPKKKLKLKTVESAYDLLFPASSARTVFDELSDVKIKWRKSGGCKDLHDKEKDGSAFNSDGKVCISLDRIDAKATKNTAGILALALIAHELTHRQHGNERQAVAVQRIVGDSLGSGNLKGLVETLKSTTFIAKARSARNSFEVLKHSDLTDYTMTCFKLQTLSANLETILTGESSLMGMRRYSPETQMLIPQIRAFSASALGYCALSGDEQLLKSVNDQVAKAIEHIDDPIDVVLTHDKVSLKKRLQRLSAPLEKVFSDLEAIGLNTKSSP